MATAISTANIPNSVENLMMRETVQINCGDYSYKERVFSTEVRRSFCDLAIDYEVVSATDN